jgi:hypothetical protein
MKEEGVSSLARYKFQNYAAGRRRSLRSSIFCAVSYASQAWWS